MNNSNYKTSWLLAAVLFIALPAQATTWDFTPGGTGTEALGSGFGNSLNFLQDEELLVVTSWYEFGNKKAKFREANVSQFDLGLGACNQREGNSCYADGVADPVDNDGQREWLLLELDQSYTFASATVSAVDAQLPLGLSLWIGSLAPGASLDGVDYPDLAGLGFGPQTDVSLAAGNSDVALNAVLGNALLIGASRYGGSDAFYLQSLTASPAVVPLPPAVWMFGSALGLLAWLRRSLSLPVAKGQEW